MGSFANRASPVLVLSPNQQSHSHPYGMDAMTASSFPTPNGSSTQDALTSQPNTPSAAGKKRTREESNVGEETYFTQVPAPKPVSEEGWEYGEGMTLIRPNGVTIDASSQSGTWADEKIPTPPIPQLVERPVIRSYKSQRLDRSADSMTNGDALRLHDTMDMHSPPKTSLDPTIDDFTIHLGIGWSRISEEAHIQAAARGWAKYIENHFPVSQPQIRLESKGLSSYLVETREGWFLFGEDLKQGRLVSTSLDRAFMNLRSNPPSFDGDVVLDASALTPAAPLQGVQQDPSTVPMVDGAQHIGQIQATSLPIDQNVAQEMDLS